MMSREEMNIAAVKNQEARMAELKKRLPERSFKTLEGVPPRFIGRLSKVLTGNMSKKMMVRAMCEQCVGWEFTTELIGNCKSFVCALHPFRPHQTLSDVEAK